MNKKELIEKSKKIREAKDEAKGLVKEGKATKRENKGFRIIIPPQVYEYSLENQSDEWYFNGLIIDLFGDLVIVDPGLDFYSRFSKTGLNLFDVKAIVVTHGHTDHIASLYILLEKLLRDKVTKRQFFISKLAFESGLPFYHQNKVKESENVELVLLEDDKLKSHFLIDSYKIEFISLYHSIKDTIGFKIKHPEGTFGYVSDTGYATEIKTEKGLFSPENTEGNFQKIVKKHDYIKNFYSDCEVVAVNINDLHYNRHSKYHLSGWDVSDMLEGTSVKELLLLHLSPINALGEEGNEIYRLFFNDESYKICLPPYAGKTIRK